MRIIYITLKSLFIDEIFQHSYHFNFWLDSCFFFFLFNVFVFILVILENLDFDKRQEILVYIRKKYIIHKKNLEWTGACWCVLLMTCRCELDTSTIQGQRPVILTLDTTTIIQLSRGWRPNSPTRLINELKLRQNVRRESWLYAFVTVSHRHTGRRPFKSFYVLNVA